MANGEHSNGGEQSAVTTKLFLFGLPGSGAPAIGQCLAEIITEQQPDTPYTFVDTTVLDQGYEQSPLRHHARMNRLIQLSLSSQPAIVAARPELLKGVIADPSSRDWPGLPNPEGRISNRLKRLGVTTVFLDVPPSTCAYGIPDKELPAILTAQYCHEADEAYASGRTHADELIGFYPMLAAPRTVAAVIGETALGLRLGVDYQSSEVQDIYVISQG